MRLSLAATIVAVLLPPVAFALDVPATYDVEAKALKEAVAGTPITFNLYTTDDCTGSPVTTEVVNVEDIGSIDVVKQFTPKDSPKRPVTGKIRQVITTDSGDFKYRLTVTGTGIVPVGGACQPQYASLPTAIAESVPSGVIPVGGPYVSLASLALTAPMDGKIVLMFETELDAIENNQLLTCIVTQDMGFVGSFEMDPGDADTPIHNYDLLQSHYEVVSVTEGAHTFDVSCSLPTGAPVNTIRAKLAAVFAAASM